MAATLQVNNDVLTPSSLLRIASLATEASATLEYLDKDPNVDRSSLSLLADALPILLSASSLRTVDIAFVKTIPLIAVGSAIRQLPQNQQKSIQELLEVLVTFQGDLVDVSDRKEVAVDRIQDLNLFCLNLARQLLDQISSPSPHADGMRV